MKPTTKTIIGFILLFSAMGLAGLAISRADTSTGSAVKIEAEEASAELQQTNDDASNNLFLEFNQPLAPTPPITPVITPEPTKTPFIFAAAGDFNNGTKASEVLTKLGQDNTDFTLALGDLGYDGNGTEREWCSFVKQRVGDTYPFQLLVGNHDDKASGDGDILEYRKCLPNQIDPIVGDYALEYYFDYNDLARFIQITPSIRTYGNSYDSGDPGYNWVKDTVQDARENGINWVVLSMHKNCITVGVKNCEIGEDIMNLALESGVDLILQGHEHGYYRSNQWALSAGCSGLESNKFNSNCVAQAGSDFKKGKGTVLVVSGAGGIGLRDIDLNDPETPYFEARNGRNLNNSYGYSRFEVSEDSIKNTFVKGGTSGTFEDSFTITKP